MKHYCNCECCMALTCQRFINIARRWLPLLMPPFHNSGGQERAHTSSPRLSQCVRMTQISIGSFSILPIITQVFQPGVSFTTALTFRRRPLLSASPADNLLHKGASYFHHSFISALDSTFIRVAFISLTQQELNGLQGATGSLRASGSSGSSEKAKTSKEYFIPSRASRNDFWLTDWESRLTWHWPRRLDKLSFRLAKGVREAHTGFSVSWIIHNMESLADIWELKEL